MVHIWALPPYHPQDHSNLFSILSIVRLPLDHRNLALTQQIPDLSRVNLHLPARLSLVYGRC